MRYIKMAIVALILIALGWSLHQFVWPQIAEGTLSSFFTSKKSTPTTTDEKVPATVACQKIITPARNPATGEIKEFPTSCSVPKNWEVIQNDVPSLDLEVQ